jgi:hypothetical protein
VIDYSGRFFVFACRLQIPSSTRKKSFGRIEDQAVINQNEEDSNTPKLMIFDSVYIQPGFLLGSGGSMMVSSSHVKKIQDWMNSIPWVMFVNHYCITSHLYCKPDLQDYI